MTRSDTMLPMTGRDSRWRLTRSVCRVVPATSGEARTDQCHQEGPVGDDAGALAVGRNENCLDANVEGAGSEIVAGEPDLTADLQAEPHREQNAGPPRSYEPSKSTSFGSKFRLGATPPIPRRPCRAGVASLRSRPRVGLALCEDIVECHGGNISVETETDARSTFSFTLPAVTEEVDERHHTRR